jgi:hypothetical protein
VGYNKKPKLKDINCLKNTANNKTHTAQCFPPPGHVRN